MDGPLQVITILIVMVASGLVSFLLAGWPAVRRSTGGWVVMVVRVERPTDCEATFGGMLVSTAVVTVVVELMVVEAAMVVVVLASVVMVVAVAVVVVTAEAAVVVLMLVVVTASALVAGVGVAAVVLVVTLVWSSMGFSSVSPETEE